MATASSELDIINSNPIRNGLGTVRQLFESTRTDLGVADSPDIVHVNPLYYPPSHAALGMLTPVSVTLFHLITSVSNITIACNPVS